MRENERDVGHTHGDNGSEWLIYILMENYGGHHSTLTSEADLVIPTNCLDGTWQGAVRRWVFRALKFN